VESVSITLTQTTFKGLESIRAPGNPSMTAYVLEPSYGRLADRVGLSNLVRIHSLECLGELLHLVPFLQGCVSEHLVRLSVNV
jgi:hypothetical protein